MVFGIGSPCQLLYSVAKYAEKKNFKSQSYLEKTTFMLQIVTEHKFILMQEGLP